MHRWADATELAIVVAASMVDWVIRNKQNVGLATNGFDPMSDQTTYTAVLPSKGRAQMVRILEVLARVQAAETQPLIEVVRHERQKLPWGTTLAIICGQADDQLFEEVFRCRRYGLNPILVLVGQISAIRSIREHCEHFSIPFHHIRNEFDLDLWRQ